MRRLTLLILAILATCAPAWAGGAFGTSEQAKALREALAEFVRATPGNALPDPFRVGKVVFREEVEVAAPDVALVLEAARKSADRVLGRLDAVGWGFQTVAVGPDQVVGAWPTRVEKHYLGEIAFANDVGNARYDERDLGVRLAFYVLHVAVARAGEGRFRVTATWYEPWMMERTPASAVKEVQVVRDLNSAQVSTTESLPSQGFVFESLHSQDGYHLSQQPAAELVAGVQANLTAGATPDVARLFMAIEKDDLEAVQAILAAAPALVNERKEVVDQYGKRQDTPLHAAAQHGRLEIARVLLAAGADRNAKALYDKTPAEYAYFLAKPQMFELITKWGQ